ncbi:hypothetical protein ISN76_13405 [Dyella halodurans]|uniref:Lipoprotein n=1 Tax=Dyella halodurans TaxID=1920171 RepID=A0ABV9C4D5_9GAMM|nr:hypothetical protein [Dyella halodurans]
MTITRSFYRFTTLVLLATLAWAGVACAQQASTGGTDAPSPQAAVNAGHRRPPATSAKAQSTRVPATTTRAENRMASVRAKAGDKAHDDHYQPAQRNLIGQYQNAVTPPVDEGR